MSAEDRTPRTLEKFLCLAYDTHALEQLVGERMMGSHETLGALTPQSAHLTKDARLVVGYRLYSSGAQHTAQGDVPLFCHFCAQSPKGADKAYRALDERPTHGLLPPLKRTFLRPQEDVFLSTFPRDPELKALARVLRPEAFLALYNEELREEGHPEARALRVRLLGYRPERRAIFWMEAVSAETTRQGVVKFYRPSDAERVFCVWKEIGRLRPECTFLVAPMRHSALAGALVYPLARGETLDTLLEQGVACAEDLAQSGRLLRQLHTGEKVARTSSSAEPTAGRPPTANLEVELQRQQHAELELRATDALRVFTLENELEILERWRRFLKQSESPLAGSVAKAMRLMQSAAPGVWPPAVLLHRDFYPKQVVVAPYTRRQAFLDLDTAAWGPAMLDAANFLAHLELYDFPDSAQRQAFREAFLAGYGFDQKQDAALLALFELSSLARLLCLASVGARRDLLVERLSHTLRRQMRLLQ